MFPVTGPQVNGLERSTRRMRRRRWRLTQRFTATLAKVDSLASRRLGDQTSGQQSRTTAAVQEMKAVIRIETRSPGGSAPSLAT